jgi:hypothetical protein
MKRIACIFAICVFLSGCSDWDAKPPPETQVGQVTPALPEAFVSTGISVRTADFRNELLHRYATDPLEKGDTGDLSAKLLVEEKSVVEELKDTVVTPFKAEGCVANKVMRDCVKQEPQKIKDRCFKHFRPFDCFKVVMVDSHFPCAQEEQTCWPEVKAVVVSQLEPVIHWTDKIFPASVRIHHLVRLRDAKIEAHDEELTVNAALRLEISVDVAEGVLGEDVHIKGALACSSDFSAIATAKVVVKDGPVVDLTLTDFGFDIEKVCFPGAVELADAAFLRPDFYIGREVLEPIVKKQLLDLLNDQLQKALGDQLNFTDKMSKLAEKAAAPVALGKDLWLQLNPKRVLVSQIHAAGTGDGNTLALHIAIVAAPDVIYGEQPAASALPTPFPVQVKDDLSNDFALAARGTVQLAPAAKAIETALKDAVAAKFPQAPLTTGHVKLYQSSTQFVIGVDFVKPSGDAPVGTVYLAADPYVDTDTRDVRLKNVQFDLDSRRVLLKTANWALSGLIEAAIEQAAHFNYGGQLAKLEESIGVRPVETTSSGPLDDSLFAVRSNQFHRDMNGITVDGKLDKLDVTNIWVGDDAINVAATAKGAVSVNIRPGEH